MMLVIGCYQDASFVPPAQNTHRELLVARPRDSGADLLEIMSFEERRILLGHSW